MPIVFKVAVKPTPSIAQKQETINLETKENFILSVLVKNRNVVCLFIVANILSTFHSAFKKFYKFLINFVDFFSYFF